MLPNNLLTYIIIYGILLMINTLLQILKKEPKHNKCVPLYTAPGVHVTLYINNYQNR